MLGPFAQRFSVVAVCLAFAGCVEPAQGSAQVAGLEDDTLGGVRIRVVDGEIVPIAQADVALVGTESVGQTDENGAIEFLGLAAQEYSVAVTKQGYSSAEVKVQVLAGQIASVAVALQALALNVPYHESQVFVAFLDCSWAITSATFPCVPIDRVTGQNITGDQSAWKFSIPAPGLANLLHEMVWTAAQATGREMKVVVTEPGQPVFVGGVTKFYMLNEGPSPLRTMLTPGEEAQGGSVPFDGNQSAKYDAYIRGSIRNSTTPQAAIFINQRADNWFTFFYNRPGTLDFTALPDA